jgi:hypothetical protein
MTLTEFLTYKVEPALILGTIQLLLAVVWGTVSVALLVIAFKFWQARR